MEIKIGVQNIGRELSVETDQSADEIESALNEALAANKPLVINAQKGRRVVLVASQIGYLDFGPEHQRAVGFGFGDA